LIERLIVAGRIMIPDCKIARRGRLAQRLDLRESNFSESERPLVLVGHVHRLSPTALGNSRIAPDTTAAGADLRGKLGESREGRVNRFDGITPSNELRQSSLNGHRTQQKGGKVRRVGFV